MVFLDCRQRPNIYLVKFSICSVVRCRKTKGLNKMIYDKDKLVDLIDRLSIIKEYDYIAYPVEDSQKVKNILTNIENEIEKWEKMQNDNYSY